MIDIHSHIIPGIDDGARDMETSLEMLKTAEGDGTKTIFATPHFNRGYFEVEYKDVLRLTEDLNKRARENGININILPGQEVYLKRETPLDFKRGTIGTLGGSRYMLIELPMDNLPDFAMDSIYELKILGITPIIAHPERYLYIIKRPSLINHFIEEECLFQINSGSIRGLFGREVKSTAEILVKNGIMGFIASDAHTNNKRCPGLKKSFDIINNLNKEYGNILRDNVENVLNNRDISRNANRIREKKSIFSFILNK